MGSSRKFARPTRLESNCLTDYSLESVRKHHAGLHSFRSIRRIEARRRKASDLRLRYSQSFANLRQRPSQARVRSTIQRLGRGEEAFGFIRSFDDLDVDARQNAFHRALEFRPLIASVGIERDQEREGSEQARHQQRAAVAVLEARSRASGGLAYRQGHASSYL